MEWVVTVLVAHVALVLNELGLLLNFEILVEKQSTHQVLVSLNGSHEGGKRGLNVDDEWRNSALVQQEVSHVDVTSVAGPVQVFVSS